MKHGIPTETREVRIIGVRCANQDTLHDYIARKLNFPDYYGKNLSALADCLSEICVPTKITIAINEYDIDPGMQAYVIRFVQTCAREALVNENLSLIIEHL